MYSDEDLDRELARASLRDYCAWMESGYVSSEHTRLVCERLEALERGDIQNLLVMEPPSHSKTYHVSERFPSWYLGRRGDRQIILASYAAELAEANSRRARDLVMDERYPFNVKVKADVASTQRWETTAGGVVVAAGVRGGITGKHANLLIIDDPVKDRSEADSESMRDATWKWYGEVARTRLMGRGQQILTMTRWHEADLAGRILESSIANRWEILRLPALAEAGDVLGRAEGEALWPEYYPVEELADIRAVQGERAWQALYQQRPVADTGNMIQDGWWRWYAPHERPRFVRVEQFWDTAYDENVRADYTVCATWGLAADGSAYLLDIWRDKVDWPHLHAAAYRLHGKACEETGRSRVTVLIEDRGTGKTLVQALQKPPAGMKRIPALAWPESDKSRWAKDHAYLKNAAKEVRLQGDPIHMIEAGMVYLPMKADWHGITMEQFLEEHAAFPNGAHDDVVDTTIMMGWRFSRKLASGITHTPYQRVSGLQERLR